MIRPAWSGAALLFVAVLLGPQWALAETVRYVDSVDSCGGLTPCYATITDAVNAAGAGDTIEVFAGVYRETITIAHHPGNIVLQAHVETLRPVIDGGISILASPRVQVLNFVILHGVSVTAGASSGFSIEGSLVHGDISLTIVSSCTVSNNTVVGGSVGGDIALCLIEGNKLLGGSIFASRNPDPLVRPNGIVIRGNVVRGGSIILSSRSAADNTIEDNFVSGGSGVTVSLILCCPSNVLQDNTSVGNQPCDIDETSPNGVQNTWSNNRFGTKCGTATD